MAEDRNEDGTFPSDAGDGTTGNNGPAEGGVAQGRKDDTGGLTEGGRVEGVDGGGGGDGLGGADAGSPGGMGGVRVQGGTGTERPPGGVSPVQAEEDDQR